MDQLTTPDVSDIHTNPDVASGADGANAPKADTVAYETHRRLLGEKKALQAKFEELVNANSAKDEQALAEQGEYKGLYEQSKTAVEDLKGKLADAQTQQDNFRKLRAALGALGGKVDQKYYSHIGIDNILLDPDTGEVDEMSLTKTVEKFKKDHGVLIQNTTATPLPNAAPQYASGTEDMSKMSKEERMAKLGDLMKQMPRSR